MKAFGLLLLLGFMNLTAYTQDEISQIPANYVKEEMVTLFGSGDGSHGGYGGITGKYLPGNDNFASMWGLRGGWIIDHSFTLGLAGYAFTNFNPTRYFGDINGGKDYYMHGGYGGLTFEFTVAPMSPIHINFPILIGAGGIFATNNKEWAYDYDDHEWDWDHRILKSEPFLIFEPGVEVEMNLFKFMRAAVGVSYRFTSDLEMKNIYGDLLNGYSAGASLKFGSF